VLSLAKPAAGGQRLNLLNLGVQAMGTGATVHNRANVRAWTRHDAGRMHAGPSGRAIARSNKSGGSRHSRRACVKEIIETNFGDTDTQESAKTATQKKTTGWKTPPERLLPTKNRARLTGLSMRSSASHPMQPTVRTCTGIPPTHHNERHLQKNAHGAGMVRTPKCLPESGRGRSTQPSTDGLRAARRPCELKKTAVGHIAPLRAYGASGAIIRAEAWRPRWDMPRSRQRGAVGWGGRIWQ